MKPRWFVNHKIPNNTRRLQSNKSQPTLIREGRDYPRAWLARENGNANLWSCRKHQCLLESFSVSSRWKTGCWGLLTCTSLYFPPFNSNFRCMGRTLPATLQKGQGNMGMTTSFWLSPPGRIWASSGHSPRTDTTPVSCKTKPAASTLQH